MRPNESDDVLQEIRAELMAAAPSPAFAAGVRARVAGQSSASPFPKWALAAAAVVAVATGGYWLVPREDAPAIAVRLAPPPPVVGPGFPVVAPPAARPAKQNAVVRQATREAVAVTAPGPDLTVITDQPETVRRLWARAVASVSRSGLPPLDEPTEIAVAPVVVHPIVIPLIGEAWRGGLVPEVRRAPENRAVNSDNRTRSER